MKRYIYKHELFEKMDVQIGTTHEQYLAWVLECMNGVGLQGRRVTHAPVQMDPVPVPNTNNTAVYNRLRILIPTEEEIYVEEETEQESSETTTEPAV